MLTPKEVYALRMEAIEALYDNTGTGLDKLVHVTQLEKQLRETGQRPIYPPQAPLIPRVILAPLDKTPIKPAPLKKESIKQFDPQLKLFDFS